MSAWLSRVFGRKRYYIMSVALFTATSFLCGVAPSLSALVVFRVLQGVGGGGLAPVEQAILVDTFPKEKLGGAFALYSMAIVTARQDDPVVEFTLLRERNFAIANLYYFLFAFGLFGTTVLIPEILQTLFGFTATDAGLVLGPDAAVIVLLAPCAANRSQDRRETPARCELHDRGALDVLLQRIYQPDRLPFFSRWHGCFQSFGLVPSCLWP